MSLRETIATTALNSARTLGRTLGCELVIDASQHSLKTSMEQPDKTTRAWDSDLYKRGQLYYEGYANPIKPRVRQNSELETPDEVDVVEGEGEGEDSEPESQSDGPHVELISSARYRKYMRQDLISQLLTPKERWRLIAYAVLGIGILVMFNIILMLYVNGGF